MAKEKKTSAIGARAASVGPMSRAARAAEVVIPGFDRSTAEALVLSRLVKDAVHDDNEVDRWIRERRESIRLHADVVPLAGLDQWIRDAVTGNIVHRTGRFFAITGLAARHRTPYGELEWDQPIIDQPEIGILGILAKTINGVLHFCLQAKEEPGNIHSVQLSPTVQATYSNYTRVHGGALPPFLAHFLDPPPERVLYAKLQTEDGGRFLFKSNRNMIVLTPPDGADTLPDGFIWLTLRQIAGLLLRDNLVNACARSVIAALFGAACSREQLHELRQLEATCVLAAEGGLPLRPPAARADDGRAAGGERSIDLSGALQWLDDIKSRNHILQRRVGLGSLADWGMDREGFYSHTNGRFFKIIGIRVTSRAREVTAWTQPILDNVGSGIIGLLITRRRGRTWLLMQAKAEVGNRSIVQIGPTVQFTQENYVNSDRLAKPFLFDEFMKPRSLPVVLESRQSEEGARFFREEHVHKVLLLPENVRLDLPPEYRWLNTDELGCLLHMGEKVNSCARSILSTLF